MGIHNTCQHINIHEMKRKYIDLKNNHITGNLDHSQNQQCSCKDYKLKRLNVAT